MSQTLPNEEKLRVLSRNIIEYLENDRRYVARELHDSVGCGLAAIQIALEHNLKSISNGTRDGIFFLENIIASIKSMIKEVRRISNHLIPSMLEDFGLLEAIRCFCQEQSAYYKNTRIITKLKVDEDNLCDLSKTTIFRVIQEAMKNALHNGSEK